MRGDRFFRIRVACFLPFYLWHVRRSLVSGSRVLTRTLRVREFHLRSRTRSTGTSAHAVDGRAASNGDSSRDRVGGETAEKLKVTGILSGVGWTEGNHIAGDPSTHWDVQQCSKCSSKRPPAGGNSICKVVPTTCQLLGCPSSRLAIQRKNVYGAFPQGYLKLVKGNASVEIGALPTLIGAEYTFSFENMNIQRGLLWNQENAVNRGIQLSDTYKN